MDRSSLESYHSNDSLGGETDVARWTSWHEITGGCSKQHLLYYGTTILVGQHCNAKNAECYLGLGPDI